MLLWIGVVVGLLIASAFNTGITSAILDFIAFLILLVLGVRRATAAHAAQEKKRMLDESAQQSSDRVNLTP